MTVEDIIAGYYDETKENAECDAYADTGAVVTKDVPPFTVAGGVPARIIKNIDKEG